MNDAGAGATVDDPGSVALVAGAGRLPLEAAAVLQARGPAPPAIVFDGLTDPRLSSVAGELVPIEMGQLGAMTRALRSLGAQRLLLVGGFPRKLLLGAAPPIRLDAEAQALLAGAGALSDDGLMTSIAAYLEREGFELLAQAQALRDLLVPPGPITRRAPGDRALADLRVGCPVLAALGRVGLGQCVVVEGGAVLAVEVVEGTDETIRRAGRLGGGAATVIKARRPDQDPRLDLPTVGPDTVAVMSEAGATALALEAGAALMVDRASCIAEADRLGITIWGFDPEAVES